MKNKMDAPPTATKLYTGIAKRPAVVLGIGACVIKTQMQANDLIASIQNSRSLNETKSLRPSILY